MANYFDFHFHPLFKKNVVKFEGTYPTQRQDDDISGVVILNNDIVHKIDKDSLHIIESQSCIDQVKALMSPSGNFENGFLGVANITCIEYGFTDIRGIAKLIFKLDLASPLDAKYFDFVKNSQISYYQLMIKELSLYRQLSKDGVIQILSRKNAAQDLNNLPQVQTFALSIEGGHNLIRTKANLPCTVANLDTPQAATAVDSVYTDFKNNQQTLLSSADSLKHLHDALWADGLDLCYLTLTHLSCINEMQLATHAYGMKLLNEPDFYPRGNGLTDAGKQVIDAAYKMQADGKPTPILVDIKHMGLKSRIDFYNYRKANNYKLPIIASHIAVNGYSIKNWIKEAQLLDQNHNTGADDGYTVYEVDINPKVMAFEDNGDELLTCTYKLNPWAINLFDEDIREVLSSGGLLGVIMDSRVLGAKLTLTSTNALFKDYFQYFSKEEYQYLFEQGAPDIEDANGAPNSGVAKDEKGFELNGDFISDDDRNPDREVISLAINIIHIIAVGFRCKIDKPWLQIAIGSDYDGLIEPLEYALNCTSIATIEERLMKLMPLVERSYLIHNPTPDGFGILPGNDDGSLDTEELAKWIRGFMFDNGKNFLNRWYTGNL